MADVDKWVYSSVVKDHFMRPRGFLLGEPKEGEFDSYGEVGSLACGDIIKVWIKVDKETDKIKDFKKETQGGGAAPPPPPPPPPPSYIKKNFKRVKFYR